MLIGSCITGSQPKRVFHVHHSVAIFADKRYDLSHKSIVVNPKSETAAQMRKIWQLKRKSVKRAFKAYTLRQKRKSKQVCTFLPLFSFVSHLSPTASNLPYLKTANPCKALTAKSTFTGLKPFWPIRTCCILQSQKWLEICTSRIPYFLECPYLEKCTRTSVLPANFRTIWSINDR